jgi:hypothetical protein
MSVPILINLTMAAAPLGWNGKVPGFINLFGESLSGELDPSVLIGRSGGAMPTHDIGPWFDYATNQWWFFDPGSSQYQPGEQGCPIGTIAMIAGSQGYQPQGWITCDGSEISRSTYRRLFQAVGETWGAGDGASTFNLPPGAKIYMNAAGWVPQSRVPLDITDESGNPITPPTSGVGSRGGSQLSGDLLATDVTCSHFDWMKITLRTSPFKVANALPPNLPGNPIPNLQAPGTPNFTSTFSWGVTDMTGKALGSAQQQFPIMPPFACINHMIKYQ